MKVTADQVESIRAMLTRDAEGFERISKQLDPATRPARGALISAAFFLAAERRFKGGSPTDVTAFVDDLRTRRGLADEIDARTAERLLLATFTDEDIEDINGDAQADHFAILLSGIIADASLSDAQLDVFLDDARKLANEWLADDPR